MLYVRGNKHDYEHWEQDGNPGWGYKDVLHYFKKSEDNRNPYLAATDYHGTGGYLTVQEVMIFLGQFSCIFRSNFGQFSDNFWSIFGLFLVYFWSIFGQFSVNFQLKFALFIRSAGFRPR